MSISFRIGFLLVAVTILFLRELTIEAAPPDQRPRLLVLTDIGGDPDDQQSMIRLMLYCNEFDIEGLVASASGTPGELKQAVTRLDLVREIVAVFGQVGPNLLDYADGWPETEFLLSRIKTGNPQRGRNHIGESDDTEGSRWIIRGSS